MLSSRAHVFQHHQVLSEILQHWAVFISLCSVWKFSCCNLYQNVVVSVWNILTAFILILYLMAWEFKCIYICWLGFLGCLQKCQVDLFYGSLLYIWYSDTFIANVFPYSEGWLFIFWRCFGEVIESNEILLVIFFIIIFRVLVNDSSDWVWWYTHNPRYGYKNRESKVGLAYMAKLLL